MEMKKGKAVFWLKGLVWLLMVMFIFTIVSRAAGSVTTAKVKVCMPASRKIQHAVSAEGRIVKNREISVITQPDILVKSVFVSEGQRVKKGEVLARLDMGHLGECIDSIKGGIEQLMLQNEALKENRKQAQDKRMQELSRAKSDYEHLRQKNSRALKKAEDDVAKAKEKLKNYKSKKDKSKETLVSLRADIEEKIKYRNDLSESIKTEEKAAMRAVEDAMPAPEHDNTAKVNDISIKDLEKQLEKLKKIREKKGRILSPKDGVITSVLVNVGQKTADTGVFLLTDYSAGLKFEGQMAAEDAKHVMAGDTVTIQSAGRKEDVTVSSVQPDENGGPVNITAFVSADLFSLGETVALSAVKESATYKCTVPVTAVYQDSGKNYVLLAKTESTVLGEQETARKMEVKVLEKNGIYAALDDSMTDSESRIIADTDRFVEAGDRVRILEE